MSDMLMIGNSTIVIHVSFDFVRVATLRSRRMWAKYPATRQFVFQFISRHRCELPSSEPKLHVLITNYAISYTGQPLHDQSKVWVVSAAPRGLPAKEKRFNLRTLFRCFWPSLGLRNNGKRANENERISEPPQPTWPNPNTQKYSQYRSNWWVKKSCRWDCNVAEVFHASNKA